MQKHVRMEEIHYIVAHYRRYCTTLEGAIQDLREKFPGATIVKIDSDLQDFRDNEYHFKIYLS